MVCKQHEKPGFCECKFKTLDRGWPLTLKLWYSLRTKRGCSVVIVLEHSIDWSYHNFGDESGQSYTQILQAISAVMAGHIDLAIIPKFDGTGIVVEWLEKLELACFCCREPELCAAEIHQHSGHPGVYFATWDQTVCIESSSKIGCLELCGMPANTPSSGVMTEERDQYAWNLESAWQGHHALQQSPIFDPDECSCTWFLIWLSRVQQDTTYIIQQVESVFF